MRTRYIIWIFLVGTIHTLSWYYAMCFCGVYINSNKEWLMGAFISIFLSIFVFEVCFVLFKTILWKLAQTLKNECCMGMFSLYCRITSWIK
mmetsp:Transcript_21413/g.22226  ORF Transcript_21413/g.22226 Transcript_21413/m.22226 type:complete len:91 (+) Transcript_21413:3863-4135(+)